jgi:hypothetical protein
MITVYHKFDECTLHVSKYPTARRTEYDNEAKSYRKAKHAVKLDVKKKYKIACRYLLITIDY